MVDRFTELKMEDIENYTSLQEFTEDTAHSGNRPILTSQSKQGNVCVLLMQVLYVNLREEWNANHTP